ncbi:diguanylate cyclase domain-containing protein [Shewanella sp. UCD-KL12]|uniref:diguanylate cyclase domain-containing protein n=1 Tax=Shewanella sp. UCD-KL12 TaxID=1917163 RepID=UPI0009703E48|nr:diguanylate cyclase [Shewanella sp. UCD-KL12]
MSIRLKLSLLLAALFCTAIVNSIFTILLEGYGEEKLKWVNHTHDVIIVSEQFLGAMKDAETGQRGFLLTKNTAYLEPYHTGGLAAKKYIAELRLLTVDNSDQQARVVEIEDKMKLKFAELTQTVELAQMKNLEAALDIVVDNRGKLYMDHIRQLLSSFINIELILLEQRKGDYSKYRAQITTLMAVEFMVFIVLALFTVVFLQRDLFAPLKLLLKSAKIVEKGKPLVIEDIIEKNEMGHLLSTFYNMSDKVFERERELSHQAEHDQLTGLKNKSSLSEDLNAMLQRCRPKSMMTAAIFIDLNLFKQINDNYGHDVGDLMLQETARRISSSVSHRDSVYRFGGDEFLILASDIEHNCDIQSLINRIISAFEAPAVIKGTAMTISVSIGAAVAPIDALDGETLVRYADIAMYKAKLDEGSSYRLFEPTMVQSSSNNE